MSSDTFCGARECHSESQPIYKIEFNLKIVRMILPLSKVEAVRMAVHKSLSPFLHRIYCHKSYHRLIGKDLRWHPLLIIPPMPITPLHDLGEFTRVHDCRDGICGYTPESGVSRRRWTTRPSVGLRHYVAWMTRGQRGCMAG